MKFTACSLSGVFLLEQEPRPDDRGYFARLWCERELAGHGLCGRLAQVNVQVSPRVGTLRGMHYQSAPHAEVKIARCNRGRVFDVAVDLRPDSPTRHRWFGVELTAGDGRMLYIPQGCAHGYLTLEPATELMYFTSEFYVPGSATGVRYDDPAVGIAWPAEPQLVSTADLGWPLLKESLA